MDPLQRQLQFHNADIAIEDDDVDVPPHLLEEGEADYIVPPPLMQQLLWVDELVRRALLMNIHRCLHHCNLVDY